MSVLDHAKDLQQMMFDGKTMEAFEKYYHEDVKVIEVPTGEERHGKGAQRKALEEWMNSVEGFHGGGIDSVCSDEENQVTTAESWSDISFKDGSRMKMAEVAVQKWKDGQIIEEKFYYNMPGTSNE